MAFDQIGERVFNKIRYNFVYPFIRCSERVENQLKWKKKKQIKYTIHFHLLIDFMVNNMMI